MVWNLQFVGRSREPVQEKHRSAKAIAIENLSSSRRAPLRPQGVRNAHVFTPTSTYRFTLRSRSAFPTTDSELRLIAALAQMGLIRMPKKG